MLDLLSTTIGNPQFVIANSAWFLAAIFGGMLIVGGLFYAGRKVAGKR